MKADTLEDLYRVFARAVERGDFGYWVTKKKVSGILSCSNQHLKRLLILSKSSHSNSGGFPGISLFIGSFYNEFHEWTNFTNTKP